MPRYVRNTLVLLKSEVTYGTDPVPTAAANSLLVSNLVYPEFNANNVPRDNVRPYFGSSEELVGTYYVTLGFDLELAGSGTAGTAPAWAKALLAAGFAETLVASTCAEYRPVTDSQGSCTIYWYDSGVLRKVTGARGNVMLMLKVGERPVLRFTYTGIYNAITAVAVPTDSDFDDFETPEVVTTANSGDVTFGATYSEAVFTGGTGYPSMGLEIDVGQKVEFIPLLGREAVEITDRQATLKLALELTAAQEVSFKAEVLANTTTAVSLQHGDTAGNIVGVHMPTVQKINPKLTDQQGLRLVSYDGRLVPTTAGNDEIVIFAA